MSLVSIVKDNYRLVLCTLFFFYLGYWVATWLGFMHPMFSEDPLYVAHPLLNYLIAIGIMGGFGVVGIIVGDLISKE